MISLACLVALLSGCSTTQTATAPAAWPIDWHAERYQEHPLVGRIWQPRTQSWASPDELRNAVIRADYVLLGETHDNPDHHLLQAQLLSAMVDAGRKPALAFEMFDVEQQPALSKYLASDDASAAGLGDATGWGKSSWPAWSYYAPIAEVALAHDLEIIAANLPTETVKSVAFQGFDALDPGRVKELGLDLPLPAKQRETMREMLYRSHCELVPRSALDGMIRAQRARNTIMATRLQLASGDDGAVLITGSGHAHKDFAVPAHLPADAKVLSVAMREVKPGKVAPAEYARRFNLPRLPFDYVLFTPAAAREDPCESLRKKFGNPSTSQS